MNALLRHVQLWATRFDALSLRERVLVGAALLALSIAAWQLLLMDRLELRGEQLQGELRGLRAQIAAQDEQAQALLRRQSADPDAENHIRLSRLKAQHAALDVELRERIGGLIEPGHIPRVLEQLLTRNQRLELVRIETLPPEPLVAGGEGVYRHRVVLEFRGAYLQALDYLRALGALPWALHWESVSLEIEEHPRALVRIHVYTLGLREGWIGV